MVMTSLILEVTQLCILPFACDISEDSLTYIHQYVILANLYFLQILSPKTKLFGSNNIILSIFHEHVKAERHTNDVSYPEEVLWVGAN